MFLNIKLPFQVQHLSAKKLFYFSNFTLAAKKKINNKHKQILWQVLWTLNLVGITIPVQH
jgi:hypothetical protein